MQTIHSCSHRLGSSSCLVFLSCTGSTERIEWFNQWLESRTSSKRSIFFLFKRFLIERNSNENTAGLRDGAEQDGGADPDLF